MKYAWIAAHRERYSIPMMCELLGVSRSGWYQALRLQVLYGVRSERLLVEQLGYNLLFRWFVGLSMQDDPWDHSTFSNRTRGDPGDICYSLDITI